jgi:hypothetical protein
MAKSGRGVASKAAILVEDGRTWGRNHPDGSHTIVWVGGVPAAAGKTPAHCQVGADAIRWSVLMAWCSADGGTIYPVQLQCSTLIEPFRERIEPGLCPKDKLPGFEWRRWFWSEELAAGAVFEALSRSGPTVSFLGWLSWGGPLHG